MPRARTAPAIAWVAMVVPVCALAQSQSTPDRPLTAESIVVTATRLPQPLREVPAAVSVVEKSDIQGARQTLGLDEPLSRVPGVFVQNSGNFAQDLRIQIRGFGTRAAFGIREIKLLVDELPETLPDGQTQIDAIDLGAIDRVEVLRGPASSLYGNASGGVIQLFTEDGPDTPRVETRLTGGSYGLGKYQLKGGGQAGRAHLFVHSSYLQLDGFREHSATQSATLTGKLRYDVSDSTELTVLVNGVDAPTADDAGGLTRAEADADPGQARALNMELNAGEAVQQGRLGGVVRRRTEHTELSAYAYVLYRDFENRLAVRPEAGDGIITFHRFGPGGGARSSVRPVSYVDSCACTRKLSSSARCASRPAPGTSAVGAGPPSPPARCSS